MLADVRLKGNDRDLGHCRRAKVSCSMIPAQFPLNGVLPANMQNRHNSH
jgi:hypothetical protein